MKIQAKDLEVGMEVRDGYVTLNIEEIIKGKLKNGKDTITAKGLLTRKHTGVSKTTSYQGELTFKALTKVNV